MKDKIAYSVKEAAAAVGVSEKFIRNELRSIRHARIGSRIVITAADLAAWVEARIQPEYHAMRKYQPPKEKSPPSDNEPRGYTEAEWIEIAEDNAQRFQQ